MSNVVRKSAFETKRRHTEQDQQLEEEDNKISERYAGDIKRFILFCHETDQEENARAMVDYLYLSLTEQRIKKTTWERRLAAIKRYLLVTYRIDLKDDRENSARLKTQRTLYKNEEYRHLTKLKGKSSVDKQELLVMIYELPIRERAITLVNLITANRPNEMVRLKIGDFDLDARVVEVDLKKQDTWHKKRLTLECVKVVREYIKKYNLKKDDYFVGRFNYRKSGKYESVQISEIGYTKALQRWTGLTGYNFRKTQIVAMHEAGADLPTIAAQTGHKSLEVIDKHYLDVAPSTVDKYL